MASRTASTPAGNSRGHHRDRHRGGLQRNVGQALAVAGEHADVEDRIPAARVGDLAGQMDALVAAEDPLGVGGDRVLRFPGADDQQVRRGKFLPQARPRRGQLGDSLVADHAADEPDDRAPAECPASRGGAASLPGQRGPG